LNPWARIRSAPDFPLGLPSSELELEGRELDQSWGAVPTLARWSGSLAVDRRFTDWLSMCERLALTPNEGRRMLSSIADFDVRDVLPSVNVPTLVVSWGVDAAVSARDVADRVPGARFVELPGMTCSFSQVTTPGCST
jgi:pimeloyl-ACP methyl ester carboxylesterase